MSFAAGLHPDGLHSIDEEDGMQPSTQSSEDEDTAVGGQSRFTCERCGQGFTERRSLTRHQTRTKRCADAGLDSRAESCECCDPPRLFVRADTRRLHETRKRRKLHRGNPAAAQSHAQSTGVSSSAAEQHDRQLGVSSDTASRSVYEPGHAYLAGDRAHEIDEIGVPNLGCGFGSASGEDCGSRSRSSSSEGHDSGIELQPGIPDVGLASLHTHLRVGYTPVADIAMPFAPIAEQVSPQPTTNEPLAQGNVEMLDDILQYDWQQDPEGYLALVDLDALAGTQVVSLDDDGTMVWQHEPDNADDRPTTSTSDAVSVRSTSSRRSISSMPGRFLSSVRRSPPSIPRGRNNMTLKAQRCLVCKKPYEQDIANLRAHLGRHLDEFRAAGTVPTCDICEIGFATQLDLDWHLHCANRGQPGQCCGLPADHEQPCKGYRCGFDFKHDRPCNGHHPPSDGGLAWTEYDRFKFGQFLRKWEGTQVRVVASEARTLEYLRSFKAAFDNLSLPDLRRHSVHSRISKFSWRSEPVGHAYEMHELQDRLQGMALDGVQVQMRRNARRLAGMRRQVDDELHNAVSASDIDSALKLLRRGAKPRNALFVAVENNDVEMTAVLLRAGAHVELAMLYKTVSAGQAIATRQLLGHRSHAFVASDGAILLQLAIRSTCQDTLQSILSSGVAVDEKPTADQLVGYANYAASSGEMRRRSAIHYPVSQDLTADLPLCVAAWLGHDWAVTCLLRAGVDICRTDILGHTALDLAIRTRNTRATKLLLDAGAARSSKGFHALLSPGNSLDDAVEDAMIIEMLAACGVDVNALDTHDHTPLYHACQQNRTMAMEALLRAGASPTCRALHVAVRGSTTGSRQCIQKLVAAGADLNQLDGQGCPPLKLAALHLRAEAFGQLIDAGADINGFSILDLHELMCKRPGVSVAPLLGSMFAHEIPILEFTSGDGKSILHHAAANGDVESILVLGAADAYSSDGKLGSMRHTVFSEARETLCPPRTTMSIACLRVLYFELTGREYQPAHELSTGDVRLKESLSTHYDVCEALLHFQPPGLTLDFSREVIMTILHYGFVQLEPAISIKFVHLLLQKSCAKLTLLDAVDLVLHAVEYSSTTDSSTIETIRLLLNSCAKALHPTSTVYALRVILEYQGSGDWFQEEIEVLLLRHCERGAELSRLCKELLCEPLGRLGFFPMRELGQREVLARAMAREGFEIPKWREKLFNNPWREKLFNTP
ncbi:Ankyrin repeat domain-containing protein 22 [Elasticomyces elasticus]|nr:Ankyrin repeat domain-containing protein 22 [Elasticomyces elasticus]